MSKELDNLLTITTEDGTEILCEILFTYESKEFNKKYVVFTEQGTNNASAAIYIPGEDGSNEGRLEEIKTEEEWQMLEEVLEDYTNKTHEGCGCGCEDCEEDCDCGDDDCDCEDEECGCEDEECGCEHHKHE